MRYVDKIKDHFWLRFRNSGASLKLVGNVRILTVFVEDKTSKWDDASKSQFWRNLNTAIEEITKSAASYGVRLNLQHSYFDMSVPASHKGDWKSYFPEFFHRKSISELQDYYEKSLCSDETPFIFVFNRQDRGYASSDKAHDGYDTDEYSVVFKPFNVYTIIHELLHQFGARDYYFPQWVADIAVKYYPSSVMLSLNNHIDDLTAYLIGWKDDVSLKSYELLKATVGLTEEKFYAALKAEWAKTNKKT